MLTSSYPLYPGDTTAPFIEELAAGMVALGHEVAVVLPAHARLHREPVDRGVRLHAFQYAPGVPWLQVWGYASALEGDVGLRRAAYAVAPLALAASTMALARLARRLRPDLLVAHWVIPNGPPAAFVARAVGVPLAIALHGSDVYVAAKQRFIGWAARSSFGVAELVTACSADLAVRAEPLGAVAGQTQVIPYGVDSGRFRPANPTVRAAVRAELGLNANVSIVLAGGRLVHKKGLDVAIEAFARLAADAKRHSLRLVLFGDGALRPALERMTAERGLAERVLLVGRWERERLADLFGASDFFLLPSVRDFAGNVDGLPNTLLEAMSSGLAIVASNVAGVPSVIEGEEHGLLVPPGDSVALAAAIGRLADNAPLAAALGRNARLRVERELTWGHIAARYADAYQRAVSHRAEVSRRQGAKR